MTDRVCVEIKRPGEPITRLACDVSSDMARQIVAVNLATRPGGKRTVSAAKEAADTARIVPLSDDVRRQIDDDAAACFARLRGMDRTPSRVILP